MIRVDAVWLATAPIDMRAGPDTALAHVVAVFGAAHSELRSLWLSSASDALAGIWPSRTVPLTVVRPRQPAAKSLRKTLEMLRRTLTSFSAIDRQLRSRVVYRRVCCAI